MLLTGLAALLYFASRTPLRSQEPTTPGADTKENSALSAGESKQPEGRLEEGDRPRDGASVPATSKLIVRFDHHITSGTFTVYVDGRSIYTGDLRARKKKRFVPGLKLSREQIEKECELPSGRHEFKVSVQAQKPRIDKTDSCVGTLEPDGTHILRINVERVSQALGIWLE